MHAQEDVLREILGARSIGNGAGNQREHQILELLDEFFKRAGLLAAAAIDELPLAGGLHQPW